MLIIGTMATSPPGGKDDLFQTGRHTGLALLGSDNLGLSLVRDIYDVIIITESTRTICMYLTPFSPGV